MYGIEDRTAQIPIENLIEKFATQNDEDACTLNYREVHPNENRVILLPSRREKASLTEFVKKLWENHQLFVEYRKKTNLNYF